MYDQQLEADILDALRNDTVFSFKETTRYFEQGRCPKCSRKSVYIAKAKPGRIACSHRESCSKGDYYNETTRQRYADLFENITDRYPATQDDPNAGANAYMSGVRGFPLVHIGSFFSQGNLPLKSGRLAPTVRFNLWDGYYWERLINAKDVREYGDKNHNKKGLQYRNKCWQPPGQKIAKGDTVFIVEGIFHAIALHLIGKKAVAAFTSGNLPRDLIDANKKKNITWALAFDNDENGAGNKAAVKFRNELRNKYDQDKVDIYLCPKGKDWDDIYREGQQEQHDERKREQLDDDFLAECLHRGRVNTAETLQEKCYWLYSARSFSYRVVDFDSRFYSVSIKDFADDLAKAIDDASQLQIDGSEKAELFNAGLDEALLTDTGKQLFFAALESTAISNCLPRFLFAQVDKLSQEIGYNFAIDFPGDTPQRLVTFSGSAVESPASFNKALLNQAPGATFDGSANQLKRIRDNWFNRKVLIVDSVPFVGYDKDSGVYIYPDFAFYQGIQKKPNKSGFVTAGKTCIKTTLKSIPIQTSKTFAGDWVNNFFTVFHYNGLACLGFFLGSLYAEQIRAELGFFPFFELTGEAGAGKTTLLEFCWKLLGRKDHEGFNPSKATFAARSRAFTQTANMPLALIEGDSRDGKDGKKGNWDNSELKDLFNGRGIRATGAFNRGNDIEEPPFRGSVLIAQNASVDGDEAILTRIVHMHATRAHQKRENKAMADWFRRVEMGEVNGFLYKALSNEKAVIDCILKNYKRLDESLAADEGIKHARVIECHALVGAMVNALPLILPQLSAERVTECERHIHARALDRQGRLNADHPTVASFWEIYDLLNVRLVTEAQGYPGRESVTLNHSKDPALIAINLQEFNQEGEKHRYERLDLKDLRKLLPGSQRHKFIGNRTVKSDIHTNEKGDPAGRWCAVFKNSEYNANA